MDEFRRKEFRRLVSWTAIAVVLAANVAANTYAKYFPAWVDGLTTNSLGSATANITNATITDANLQAANLTVSDQPTDQEEDGSLVVGATSAVCTVAVQAVFTMFFHVKG